MKEVSSPNNIESLNNTQVFDFRTLEWNAICGWDDYGDTKSNSPIWVRPNALIKNKIDGYIHVVGHTWHSPNEIEDLFKQGENNGVYIVDTLPHHYLVIEDNNFKYVEISYEKENDSV